MLKKGDFLWACITIYSKNDYIFKFYSKNHYILKMLEKIFMSFTLKLSTFLMTIEKIMEISEVKE